MGSWQSRKRWEAAFSLCILIFLSGVLKPCEHITCWKNKWEKKKSKEAAHEEDASDKYWPKDSALLLPGNIPKWGHLRHGHTISHLKHMGAPSSHVGKFIYPVELWTWKSATSTSEQYRKCSLPGIHWLTHLFYTQLLVQVTQHLTRCMHATSEWYVIEYQGPIKNQVFDKFPIIWCQVN